MNDARTTTNDENAPFGKRIIIWNEFNRLLIFCFSRCYVSDLQSKKNVFSKYNIRWHRCKKIKQFFFHGERDGSQTFTTAAERFLDDSIWIVLMRGANSKGTQAGRQAGEQVNC